MAKFKLKRDDSVVVIAGAEKGKTGRVLNVDRDNGRVLVEGVNRRKKTVRRSQDNPQGGIIERESPVHISNVMLEERYRQKHPDAAPSPSAATDNQADA
jgi:large subunit ribosomal protein L24